MDFAESNIYALIASYIPVEPVDSCVIDLEKGISRILLVPRTDADGYDSDAESESEYKSESESDVDSEPEAKTDTDSKYNSEQGNRGTIASKAVYSLELLHLAENRYCGEGEFTVFSFCELYNVDVKRINGTLFRSHLFKLLDKIRQLCSKKETIFLPVVLQFVIKIHSDCHIINTLIHKILHHIRNYSGLKIPVSLKSMLYDKLLSDIDTNIDRVFNRHIDIQHNVTIYKRHINYADTKTTDKLDPNLLNHKTVDVDDVDDADVDDVDDADVEMADRLKAHLLNYTTYNIYDVYAELYFVDVNIHSPLVYNKYLTPDYFDRLTNIPRSWQHTIDLQFEDKEHYRLILKFCQENNPFYKFVENKRYLIVGERDFHSKFSKYTNDIFSNFNLGKYGVWDNFIVAGGAIFNCLNDYGDQDVKTLDDGDIDIFFYGDAGDQQRALEHVLNTIKKYANVSEIISLCPTVLEVVSHDFRRIQLILTNHDTPQNVIRHFDLWSASVYYDGSHVIGNLNFLYSIKFWHEKLHKRELKPKSMLRIAKYMKKGMRAFLSSEHRKENDMLSIDDWAHTGLTLDAYIEHDIMRRFGDILHNKLRTILHKDEIKTWFPQFSLLHNSKLAELISCSHTVDNSCNTITRIHESWLESVYVHPDINRYMHGYGTCLDFFKKYRADCKDVISCWRTTESNIIWTEYDYSFLYILNFNTIEHVDLILASDFYNFVFMDFVLDTYSKVIHNVTIHMFLEGDFSFDDKNIIVTNYNSGQAYIIRQFIDHFVDVKKFVNTKHIVFNNDNIIINYSGIGDFACNRVSVKGVLHIEYYKLSNSRYVDCDNFVVKGIFTC